MRRRWRGCTVPRLPAARGGGGDQPGVRPGSLHARRWKRASSTWRESRNPCGIRGLRWKHRSRIRLRRGRRLCAMRGRSQPDLVIMGAHGHGGLKDLIFGNTINPVRHNLDVPDADRAAGKRRRVGTAVPAVPRPCRRETRHVAESTLTLFYTRDSVAIIPAVTCPVKRTSRSPWLLTACSLLPLQCATLERLSLDDMIAQVDIDRPRQGEGRRGRRSRAGASTPTTRMQVSERFKGAAREARSK